MKDLTREIFKEAASRCITIDNDPFNIGFNTIIYDNNNIIFNSTKDENLPTLIIKDEDLFYKKLNEYVETFLATKSKFPTVVTNKEKNTMKFIISYLFANATQLDFVYPISFIERSTSFLNDTSFGNVKMGIKTEPLDSFQNSSIFLKVSEQSLFMETPLRLDISLVKKGSNGILSYDLPSVSYGIDIDDSGKKTCYVYSLQNLKTNDKEKTEEQIRYEKKIARELYKINAGVFEQESDEYKAYKNNETNYYPENISDVSPSAVLSATILIGLLASEGIENIKIVDFLPVRWHAKDYAITRMIESGKGFDSHELRTKQKLIQENITDKFLRTFRRVEYHIDGMKILSFPKEFDDCMSIYIDENQLNLNNVILQNCFSATYKANYNNLDKYTKK
jgi:hypothetical protein